MRKRKEGEKEGKERRHDDGRKKERVGGGEERKLAEKEELEGVIERKSED